MNEKGDGWAGRSSVTTHSTPVLATARVSFICLSYVQCQGLTFHQHLVLRSGSLLVVQKHSAFVYPCVVDPGVGNEITLCALRGGDVVKQRVVLVEQQLVLRLGVRGGADIHDALQGQVVPVLYLLAWQERHADAVDGES